MTRNTGRAIKICITAVILILTASSLRADIFTVSEELLLTKAGGDSSFYLNSLHRLGYDFDFPKIVLLEQDRPVVVFTNRKLENAEDSDAYPHYSNDKLQFTEIGRAGEVTRTAELNLDRLDNGNFPFVFKENNEIHIAQIMQNLASKSHSALLKTYEYTDLTTLNLKKNHFIHAKEIDEHNPSGMILDGYSHIYPFDNGNGYILFGNYSMTHYSANPFRIITGEHPSYLRNYSVIFSRNNYQNGKFQLLDTGGEFDASQTSYSYLNNTVHCVWTRKTKESLLFSNHQESIYYRKYNKYKGWTKPYMIRQVKFNQNDGILTTSVASDNRKACILWQTIEGLHRIYSYCEIGGRTSSQVREVFKEEIPPMRVKMKPLAPHKLSSIKMDGFGNVYILIISNVPDSNRIRLICKRKDQWLPPFIVAEGDGVATQPDMVIDSSGNIHIAYLKHTIDKEAKASLKLEMQIEELGKRLRLSKGKNARHFLQKLYKVEAMTEKNTCHYMKVRINE